jgi:hypothetical protein
LTAGCGDGGVTVLALGPELGLLSNIGFWQSAA